MEQQITLYHGSQQVIEQPVFGQGKKNNDFGLGSYCTASDDLAKEWAVSSLRNGFSNRYTLDTEYLNILNLNSPDYARIRERFPETNLKRIRTAYGCTQAELAERSGVSLRSIQMYEQRNKDINKASSDAIYRIAKVLGCTMEDLIEK